MAFVWVENHALVWAGVWHGACVSGKPSARLGRGMAWRLLGWKTRRSFGQGYGISLVWAENQALVRAGVARRLSKSIYRRSFGVAHSTHVQLKKAQLGLQAEL